MRKNSFMTSQKIVQEILNLDYREIKVLDCYQEENTLVFKIQWKRKSMVCPACGKRTSSRQDLWLYERQNTLKHLVLSNNKLIELKPIRRYFHCLNCKKNFMEKFSFESDFWRHTKSFESWVISSWWYWWAPRLAAMTKSSNKKIYSIINNLDPQSLNKEWLKLMNDLSEIYLWVDEHSFSWRNMVLVITELKSKKLLAVLDGITNDKLENWINSLPLKIQLKIKWYSTDMNKWYRSKLNNIVWRPLHSVDKYHLVQEANKMVDEVRKLNSWLVKMDFFTEEDLVHFKKIPQKLLEKKRDN